MAFFPRFLSRDPLPYRHPIHVSLFPPLLTSGPFFLSFSLHSTSLFRSEQEDRFSPLTKRLFPPRTSRGRALPLYLVKKASCDSGIYSPFRPFSIFISLLSPLRLFQWLQGLFFFHSSASQDRFVQAFPRSSLRHSNPCLLEPQEISPPPSDPFARFHTC